MATFYIHRCIILLYNQFCPQNYWTAWRSCAAGAILDVQIRWLISPSQERNKSNISWRLLTSMPHPSQGPDSPEKRKISLFPRFCSLATSEWFTTEADICNRSATPLKREVGRVCWLIQERTQAEQSSCQGRLVRSLHSSASIKLRVFRWTATSSAKSLWNDPAPHFRFRGTSVW